MRRLPNWVVFVFALVLLAGLAAPALANEIRGTVVSVQPEKNRLAITDDGSNELTFVVTETTRVMLNETESELADLMPNDEAIVRYNTFLFTLIAEEVRCARD